MSIIAFFKELLPIRTVKDGNEKQNWTLEYQTRWPIRNRGVLWVISAAYQRISKLLGPLEKQLDVLLGARIFYYICKEEVDEGSVEFGFEKTNVFVISHGDGDVDVISLEMFALSSEEKAVIAVRKSSSCDEMNMSMANALVQIRLIELFDQERGQCPLAKGIGAYCEAPGQILTRMVRIYRGNDSFAQRQRPLFDNWAKVFTLVHRDKVELVNILSIDKLPSVEESIEFLIDWERIN